MIIDRCIDYTANCKAIDAEEYLDTVQNPRASLSQYNQSLATVATVGIIHEEEVLCDQESSEDTDQNDMKSQFYASPLTQFILSTITQKAESVVVVDVDGMLTVNLRLGHFEHS